MFFFLPPSICFFFKEIKKRCVCGSGDGKELEKYLEFSFSIHKVCMYTHTLQYQCNPSLNCNEQYKEGIGYDSNTLWESNS